MSAIKDRYDFSLLFDVTDGNPNGDPDADNEPRIDPETNQGIITDVCIKHKVRNYVSLMKEGEPGYGLYISPDLPLNAKDQIICQSIGLVDGDASKADVVKALKQARASTPDLARRLTERACATYFDIRTFGAVMTTFASAQVGFQQIRGPVQMNFARSIDPITSMEICITRCAVTTAKDSESKDNTMGRKYIVPYALYRLNGHISAALAGKLDGPGKTGGFSEEDLALFWDALMNMFEEDHSSTRGEMTARKLIIFRHDGKYGKAPAFKLFKRVQVRRKDGVDVARQYEDYDVTTDLTDMPDGVTVEIRD